MKQKWDKGEQGLEFQYGVAWSVTASDFAGYSNDRKSTSSWVFMSNGAPISWSLQKQGLVTRSSMEAVLVVGSIVSAEAV